MSKSKKQVGQEVWDGDEFLKSILPQIPEDRREAVFSYLGEKTMMRSDYDKSYSELRRKEEEADKKDKEADAYMHQANQWFVTNQGTLAKALTLEEEQPKLKAEIDRLRAALGSGATIPDTPPPAMPNLDGYLKRDDAEKLLQQNLQAVRGAAWQDASTVAHLSAKHYKEFGEVLDPNSILMHAQKVRKDLTGAYEDMFRPRYEEKAQKAEEDRLKKMERDIEERVRAKYAQSPYPIPDAYDTTASSLPGLGGKKDEFTVAAALSDIYALRQGQR